MLNQPNAFFQPEVIAIGDLDQLHRDARTVAGFADAAFDDGCDVERLTNLGDGCRLAL